MTKPRGSVFNAARRGCQLLFSNETLRAKIASDPEHEPSASGTAPDGSADATSQVALERLSRMSPDEISEHMGRDGGDAIFEGLELPAAAEDSEVLLQRWSEVKRASAAPLTDAQYAKFLKGQDPYA